MLSQRLRLLGQDSIPKVLLASPSYPSPFHIQSSTTHWEVCPNQEVTEVTSVCHCPGDSDAIAALGVTSLSHISPLPLGAGWSLSQPGVPQAGLLPG